MADDSNFDDDLSINEYNSKNFAEELILFINIFRAMECIHKDIFSRLPGVLPPAPKRIIGKVGAYDFEKKNPYFSDSRVMSFMMIRIVAYGWDRFTRKFAEVNRLYINYKKKYKRMIFLKACKACDIENYFLEMVFFYRLLFWQYKIEKEEVKQKEQKRKETDKTL